VAAAETRPTWICHFDARMAAECAPAYRDLLDSIPGHAKILVGVACPEDAADFRQALGLFRLPDPRVEFVIVGQPITGWARDRYIMFERDGRPCVAVSPMEAVAGDRAGDVAVARQICRRIPGIRRIETDLPLEGGNVLVTEHHVFVGIGAILDGVDLLRVRRDEIERRIEALFARSLVVVGAPDSLLEQVHIDMFLSHAPDGTLLLGSPRLAYGSVDERPLQPIGEFPLRLQRAYRKEYDAIGRAMRRRGFRVLRTPILHARSGTIVTWNNAAVCWTNGRSVALVPSYGIGELERRAHAAWRACGVDVRPIATTSVIGLGGAVRCITNQIGTDEHE
jgi:N-dimethylarginine dimethylaminohydrolase